MTRKKAIRLLNDDGKHDFLLSLIRFVDKSLSFLKASFADMTFYNDRFVLHPINDVSSSLSLSSNST